MKLGRPFRRIPFQSTALMYNSQPIEVLSTRTLYTTSQRSVHLHPGETGGATYSSSSWYELASCYTSMLVWGLPTVACRARCFPGPTRNFQRYHLSFPTLRFSLQPGCLHTSHRSRLRLLYVPGPEPAHSNVQVVRVACVVFVSGLSRSYVS